MADCLGVATISDIALVDKVASSILGELLSRLSKSAPLEFVSLIAPALLLGNTKIAAHTGAMTPPSGMGVIHEFQLFSRPTTHGFTVVSDITIKHRRNSVGVVFDFEVGVEGSVASMQTRLRFVTIEEMVAFKGIRFPLKYSTDHTIWHKSQKIKQADVADYLELARDHNPIHVDYAAARALGLEGVVLPGMLLCGLAESILTTHFCSVWISQMKCRFMAAVPVGQTVNFGIVPRKHDERGFLNLARIFAVTEDNVIAAIMDVTCAPNVS